MSPEALTVPQVAELLGVSEDTVYRQVRAGHLPRKRMGRTLRVPKAFLQGFLASDAETLEEYCSRGLDPLTLPD